VLLTSFGVPTNAEKTAPQAPPADALSDALHDFFRAARRARGREARRPSNGLSLAQYHLLEPLADGPLTNGQLAEMAGVASPTATRMVDVLLARRLVTRLEDPVDRRAVLISLTPKGRQALTAKLREYDAVRRRIAAALEPDEQRVAADLLRRLADVIEEL
jgi:MarR family transcriptional regulator, organic hydroperoxide resistance regulator